MIITTVCLRTAIFVQYLQCVLLSYTLYDKADKTRGIHIESIIQTFALAFIVSHLSHQQLISHVSRMIVPSLLASLCVAVACAWICALVYHDFVMEVFLGVGLAGVTGCMHANLTVQELSHKRQTHTGTQTISRSAKKTEICVFALTLFCIVLFVLSIYLSKDEVSSLACNQTVVFTCLQTILLLTAVRYHSQANSQRVVQAAPSEPMEQGSRMHFGINTHTSASAVSSGIQLMYRGFFPFVHAALAYFDIVFVFMILYTNHIELPHEYLTFPPATLAWFELDSVPTMGVVVGLFLVAKELSRLVVIFCFSCLPDKMGRTAAYCGLIVKSICVGLLPVPYISFYVGMIAAMVSGSVILLNKLPGYTRLQEAQMHCSAALVLLVMLQFGRHIDDPNIFAFVSYIVSMISVIFVILIVLVIEASLRIDTQQILFCSLT